MSCHNISAHVQTLGWQRTSSLSISLLFLGLASGNTHFLQGFVVNEARSILWNFELTFLDLLAKLPNGETIISF